MGGRVSSTLDREGEPLDSMKSGEIGELIFDIEKERMDTFSLWPDLEHQLEVLFHSLDLDRTGFLSYSTLEPVIRHHLMQIGLTEYVTRFAKPNGSLNEESVKPFLDRYGINIYQDLDLTAWKNVMLAWIRCIQDSQERDIENWQESINQLQKEQAKKYQQALSNFQNRYLKQLEQYYHAVDATYQKEQQYRMEWENSLELQEQFYDAQIKFIKRQEENAEATMEEKMRMNPDAETQYFQYMRGHTSQLPGNLKAITLVYPTSITSTGAPISGGATLPSRRVRVKTPKKQGCW